MTLKDDISDAEAKGYTSALLTFRGPDGALWEAAAVIGPMSRAGNSDLRLHEQSINAFALRGLKVVRP